MGQITTGVGLVSGLDINNIVEQLIAIEQRPKQLVERRNTVIQSQQVAFQDINARLLSLKNSADAISKPSAFSQTSSSSSNESVLSVSSGTGATPGTYNFTVSRLVAAQQSITRGFKDANSTPVSTTGGTLSFDRGESRLDSETRLSSLNGGSGVNRGFIRVTDRAGATAVVDLRSVVSVDDVIEKINTATGVNVIAQIDGDRLSVSDASGGSGELAIGNVGTTGTATSLGLAGNATADSDGDDNTLTGTNINTIGGDTLLAMLNDGKGVRTDGGNDLVINYSGGTATVNLSDLLTLDDVFTAVDTATGGVVNASANSDGTGIQLTDTGGGGAGFSVTSGNGSDALADLGLADGQADDDADGIITGDRAIATINSKMLKDVLGGAGLSGITGEGIVPLQPTTAIADILQGQGSGSNGAFSSDIRVTDKAGGVATFNFDAHTTFETLIDSINANTNVDITASIEGQSFVITDNSGGTGNLKIENINGATTATTLGIETDADVAAATSVDLDPLGTPMSGAELALTDSAGNSANVDLAGARSVQDILDAVNNAGLGITASLNKAGNGIKLTDTAGGAGELTIADASGNVAAQLGIAGSFSSGEADTGDLDYAYVTGGTRIDDLGITRGRFTITDSEGTSFTVDLTQGNEQTIQDVIDEINGASAGSRVIAQVNESGDGISLIDNGPGNVPLSVVDVGSTTAAELGIAGTAETAGGNITGGFEKTIEVTASDTLRSIANKINDADIGIAASIINDGSSGAPFRLSLNAEDGGTDGAFVLDDGGLGFNTTTLSQAQNAVVFYGGNDPSTSVVVESKSNTLSSVIPGTDISLISTSDNPVTVTISQDDKSIVDNAKKMVDALNTVFDSLDRYDSYDQETQERGLLLGDSTVARVRNALYNTLIQPNRELTGQYDSLSEIGIRVGRGARVEFDQDKFNQALQNDRDAVEDLLTFEQFETDENGDDTDTLVAQGVGVEISKLLSRMTDGIDGVVQTKLDTLDTQVQANKDRIEQLDERLESKRQRLLAEFQQMEAALAQMQDQSSALSQISSVSMPQGGGGLGIG